MTITATQLRGARAMLGMSRGELGAAAGVAERTITDFERDAREPRKATLLAIRAVMEAAGVEFIPENGGGPGVRLKRRQIADATP